MIELVFQNSTDTKSFNKDFFAQVLNIAVKEIKLDKKLLSVSVNLVAGAKIKELNKKYRNKSKVTDVLSFPMYENSNLETRDKKQVGSKMLVSDLGDIFICLSFAKKQAKSENISIKKELARLTVHGFLHLLGYDHDKSKKEEKKMIDLENKILSKLDIF